MKRELPGYLFAALTPVLIFCLLEWLHPNFFYRNDAQLTFAPAYVDIARAWRNGEFPLLSPWCWHSTNISGMYQYGSFSIFHQVLLIVVSFAGSESHRCFLVACVYAAVASAGYFRLCRGWQWPPMIAWSAAVTATLNGWIVYRGFGDMQSHVVSFSWVPWLWWALDSEEDSSLQRLTLWLSLYCAISGGFYITDLAVAILVIFFVLKRICRREWVHLYDIAVASCAAGAMALPAFLLLMVHMMDGVRPVGADLRWRFHPLFLTTLLVPCRNLAVFGSYLPERFQEWTMRSYLFVVGYDYGVGFVPVLALLMGFMARSVELIKRRTMLWILLLLSLVLACSPSIGGAQGSVRWCQLFLPALTLLGHDALLVLQKLHANASRLRRLSIFMAPGWVGVAGLVLLRVGVEVHTVSYLVLPGLLLAWLWTFLWFALPRWRLQVSSLLSVTILVATLSIQVGPELVNGSITGDSDTPAVARPYPALDPKRVYLTLYNQFDYLAPSRSAEWNALRPGNRAMAEGVRVMNGFDSTEPNPLVDTIKMETGGTLPEAATVSALKEAYPHGLLEHWGIDGLLVASRYRKLAQKLLPNQGWQKTATVAGMTVWQTPRERPEYYSPDAVEVETQVPETLRDSLRHQKGHFVSVFLPERLGQVKPETHFGAVEVRDFQSTRNGLRAQIKTDGAAHSLLVLRRIHVLGYRARFNGEAVPLGTYDGVNLAVMLPGNRSGLLEVDFHPPGLELAGFLMVAGAILGMLWAFSLVDSWGSSKYLEDLDGAAETPALEAGGVPGEVGAEAELALGGPLMTSGDDAPKDHQGP